MNKLISWITKKEPARAIPFFDRFLSILFRLLYVGTFIIKRLCFRLIFGKEKRDKLFKKKKIAINYEFDIIPMFYHFKFLQFIIKYFRFNENYLLKITVPRYDYKIYLPSNSNDLIHLTVREDEIIEKFQPKKHEIVVDVGAHYGRYTLIAAKRVGPKGKVISIEADPKNFELLNKNIKLNKLDNVTTINCAVSSKEGKIKLYTPEKELGQELYNTIMSDRATTYNEKYIEVNANTLDNILNKNDIKHEDINWIKIDVEGAELEVLKGATNVLSKSKDISLLVEIHNLGDGKNLYQQIMDLLNNYNFKKEFEMVHESGERHVILYKQKSYY
jgi:FkbM family methyltransferase